MLWKRLRLCFSVHYLFRFGSASWSVEGEKKGGFVFCYLKVLTVFTRYYDGGYDDYDYDYYGCDDYKRVQW